MDEQVLKKFDEFFIYVKNRREQNEALEKFLNWYDKNNITNKYIDLVDKYNSLVDKYIEKVNPIEKNNS